MSLSTHKVEVVEVHPIKHPNADSLSVVQVYGYTVVVRTADFVDGDLGAYIPPDSLVDVTRPEFAFLNNGKRAVERIRAKKLRGVQSFGLLIKAPAGAKLGDDVAEQLGVTHYEPLIVGEMAHGEAESAPEQLSHLSKYDVDSLRRYSSVFQLGEHVMATEKIHGASARYAFVDGRIYCGSRTEWKREAVTNLWWRAYNNTPEIDRFCRDNPNWILYGEVYGNVQSLRYGCPRDVRFAAFDVMRPDGVWVNANEARDLLASYGVPQVPLIGIRPFDFERVCALAEGPSLVPGADHFREGVVVKPLEERWDMTVGRVCLKCVSPTYLEKVA